MGSAMASEAPQMSLRVEADPDVRRVEASDILVKLVLAIPHPAGTRRHRASLGARPLLRRRDPTILVVAPGVAPLPHDNCSPESQDGTSTVGSPRDLRTASEVWFLDHDTPTSGDGGSGPHPATDKRLVWGDAQYWVCAGARTGNAMLVEGLSAKFSGGLRSKVRMMLCACAGVRAAAPDLSSASRLMISRKGRGRAYNVCPAGLPPSDWRLRTL